MSGHSSNIRKESSPPLPLLAGILPLWEYAFPGLSHLATETALITILSAIILLLFGVLCRLRQLRIALENKSLALKKSEQHLRLMGDNLPNAAIFQLMVSPDGQVSFNYLSRGYEQIMGCDRSQVERDARLMLDHIHESDLPRLQTAYEQAKENLVPLIQDIRVRDGSDTPKWLHISAVPHQKKEWVIWDGFIQDISANKQFENALREEKQNFQNLFETIDDFLLVCDMEGRLIHTNIATEERLEYPSKALRTMSLPDLYPEDMRDETRQMIAQMQTEGSMRSSLPLQSKGGWSIPVEMSMFQGFWENKQAIFAVARDIAGRQRAENALRESQHMLRLIMDTIPMSVFWKDKDSAYLGCNQMFIHECGLKSFEEVAGKTPFDLFDPILAESVIQRDQLVIETNQPILNEQYSHTRPDGSTGWRNASIIPLHNETGQAVGVLGVWHDVTEEYQAEERLKRTLEDMERFNQLMRGRERRTLELKEEINDLLNELGKAPKYRTTKGGAS
jgi:PAS domain S-box-containing protein